MAITLEISEISSIHDKQILRLLQGKADKAVAETILKIKADPALWKSPLVVELVNAVEQAESIRISWSRKPHLKKKSEKKATQAQTAPQ